MLFRSSLLPLCSLPPPACFLPPPHPPCTPPPAPATWIAHAGSWGEINLLVQVDYRVREGLAPESVGVGDCRGGWAHGNEHWEKGEAKQYSWWVCEYACVCVCSPDAVCRRVPFLAFPRRYTHREGMAEPAKTHTHTHAHKQQNRNTDISEYCVARQSAHSAYFSILYIVCNLIFRSR